MKMYMINKGELYMEHENIDETTRYLAACENVKKIVNAIKSIKLFRTKAKNQQIKNAIYSFYAAFSCKIAGNAGGHMRAFGSKRAERRK